MSFKFYNLYLRVDGHSYRDRDRPNTVAGNEGGVEVTVKVGKSGIAGLSSADLFFTHRLRLDACKTDKSMLVVLHRRG